MGMIDYSEKARQEFTISKQEEFEERAAIIQYDGQQTQQEAEKMAFMSILMG